jgi:hypothetical protein
MAYANPFVKMSMEGHFGSSGTNKVEYWSAGLHIGGTALAPTGSALLGFLTAIAPAVSTFHSGVGNFTGTNTFLDSLSAALLDKTGHYAGGSLQTTTRYTYPAPVAGTGTPTGPWSQAMVWSLRSVVLRGPGSHGRCYYPAINASCGAATGTISGSQQAAYLANVLILVNAINVAAAANLSTPANVSLVSPIGAGVEAKVTRIGIGARLDSMESRETKIPEAYVFGNTSVSLAAVAAAEDRFSEFLEDDPHMEDTGTRF